MGRETGAAADEVYAIRERDYLASAAALDAAERAGDPVAGARATAECDRRWALLLAAYEAAREADGRSKRGA